jgi:serine/threonine protein kinase
MQDVPRIPGYELFTCLGGGLLTAVYAGHEFATDTPCAVKVLRPDWADQATAIKLLQREARACLAVQHPQLVRPRDAHVTRPPYYLVMDLLPGESLRRRLRRDYRLNVPTALWIARQAAEGLAALHRAGFIHGDIKPDNIRLLGEGHAILLDLGFAHRPGENASLLEQGYILGTVDYLAPELCGPEPSDAYASDVFSLGMTLYEMLTGELPYPSGSVDQTLRRHSSDPPWSLQQHAAALPGAVTSLVERLLARRPAERPRAAALVQQLIALEISTLGRRLSA